MNNYNSIFLIFFLLLVSCGSVKDAFTTNKGTKTEEFLVEKKSPLIVPPNFNDLPKPIENSDSSLKIDLILIMLNLIQKEIVNLEDIPEEITNKIKTILSI